MIRHHENGRAHFFQPMIDRHTTVIIEFPTGNQLAPWLIIPLILKFCIFRFFFPFRRFPEVHPRNRERIGHRWTRCLFGLLRGKCSGIQGTEKQCCTPKCFSTNYVWLIDYLFALRWSIPICPTFERILCLSSNRENTSPETHSFFSQVYKILRQYETLLLYWLCWIDSPTAKSDFLN